MRREKALKKVANTTPAAILPKGWNWILFEDETGYLEGPDKERYFEFVIKRPFCSFMSEIVTRLKHSTDELLPADLRDLRLGFCLDFVGYNEFREYAEKKVRGVVIPDFSIKLISGIKFDELECALKMIEAGANVNYRDERGLTPLNYAVQIRLKNNINPNNLKAIKFLVEHGADVNMRITSDQTGQTDLMRACCCGKVSVVKYLLEHGADPQAKDNNGKTASYHVKKIMSMYAMPEQYKDIFGEILRLLDIYSFSTSHDLLG